MPAVPPTLYYNTGVPIDPNLNPSNASALYRYFVRGPVNPVLRMLIPNGSTYFKLKSNGASSSSSSSELSTGAIVGIAVGAVSAAAVVAGLTWWGLARRRRRQHALGGGQQPKAAAEEGQHTTDSASSELPPSSNSCKRPVLGRPEVLRSPPASEALPHMSVRGSSTPPKSPFQVHGSPPFRSMRSSSSGRVPTPDGCRSPPIAELVQVRQRWSRVGCLSGWLHCLIVMPSALHASCIAAQPCSTSCPAPLLSWCQHLPCPALLCLQHVAAQDAVAAAELSCGSDATEGTIISADSLPEALREWAVDASEIQYLHHPNGLPIEIGRGASAHVYKAMYRGEVVVSWGCCLICGLQGLANHSRAAGKNHGAESHELQLLPACPALT